jgi:serine O-acetyltransferase
MINELKKDYKRNEKKFPTMIILFLYRLGNYIYYKNFPKEIKLILLVPIKIIYTLFEAVLNNEIPFDFKSGGGLRMRHPIGIVINSNCDIGENCTIFHQVTIGSNEHSGFNKAANIGNNVYIGCGAKIIGDITIGNNVKIGANAVVTKNVPNECTVVGNNIIIDKSKTKVNSQ